MDIIGLFIFTISYLLNLINNIYFFIVLISIIIISHLFFIIIKDRRQLSNLKKLINEENKISIEDLRDLPLINVVVPAWREGRRLEGNEFKDCLLSIKKLKYPKIRAIVNAGGDKETIEIAEFFKKYENFIILRQQGGKSRAAFGKIKALNDCLPYISEGIIYFIDADTYLTDELLLRLIFPIANLNENVSMGGYRPLSRIINIDLVRYLQFNKYSFFKFNLKRYNNNSVCGSNTCVKYSAMKIIGKFTENNMISEDVSRAQDMLSKGFKLYINYDYKSCMYTDFPNTLKELIFERIRLIENLLLRARKDKDHKYLIKFALLTSVSIYILISPIFIFFSIGLFYISVAIFLSIYLKKIRKYLFFKKAVDKEDYPKFPKIIFIKILFFIFIELLSTFLTLLDLKKFFASLKNMK